MQKDFFRSYFYFTKKERIALVALAVLITGFFILPAAIPDPPVREISRDTGLQNQVARWTSGDSGYFSKKTPRHGPERRYAEGPPGRDYKKTNYPGNYRESYRGNPYVKKPNESRQYVGTQYEEKPYAGSQNAGKPYGGRPYAGRNYSGKGYPYYSRPEIPSVIYINKTDSASLLPLPGIGPVLAGRIISFRDKLGGFHAVDQIAETYGLPDSTFQQIRQVFQVKKGEVRRIDLNTADLTALKRHPYISWSLARIIIAYRGQHGGFREVADLLKIEALTPEVFDKIAPYVVIGEESPPTKNNN